MEDGEESENEDENEDEDGQEITVRRMMRRIGMGMVFLRKERRRGMRLKARPPLS